MFSPRLDFGLRLAQHRPDGGRGERPAQKASHPAHCLALAQPTHCQGKQDFVERVPLIFLQQANLFLTPQPRHPHLLDGSP